MLMAVLFIIAKKWEESKSPSSHEWINKMQYARTMEHYLAINQNEVLILTTTR